MCDTSEEEQDNVQPTVLEEKSCSTEVHAETVNDVLTRLRMNKQSLTTGPATTRQQTWPLDRPWINSNLQAIYAKKKLDQLLVNVFVYQPMNVLSEFRKCYESMNARPSGDEVGDDDEVEYIWRMILACNSTGLRKMGKPRPASTVDTVMEICERLQVINDAAKYQKRLETIVSTEDGVECLVCFESFHTVDMIACRSKKKHFMCIKCFNLYVTNTRNLKDCVSAIPCADEKCESTYSVDRVSGVLSVDMVERLKDNEDTVNVNVGLRSSVVKSVIRCSCGVVGVVDMSSESLIDNNESIVACTCGLTYCVKCSNRYHGDAPCLTIEDSLQEVAEFAKVCPNCGVGIQRSHGCNHMTCSIVGGGCGHEFCWVCLDVWPRCACVRERERLRAVEDRDRLRVVQDREDQVEERQNEVELSDELSDDTDIEELE
jgi:IBR domain, a half RING-finger domain